MNQALAYEKLYELSHEDLIIFRAHLHAGSVSYPVWERRMEIVGDLVNVVTRIAKDKGYELPSVGLLMRIADFDALPPDENLQRFLGVSWSELEKSYFGK